MTIICFLATLAWVAPPRADATLLRKMTVEQMATRADRVLVVEAKSNQPHWKLSPNGRKQAIETDTFCIVKEVWKGRAVAGQSVKLHVIGGRVGEDTLIVDSMARFAVGERCLVFIDDRNRVIGGFQGKVSLDGGPSTDAEVDGLRHRVAVAIGTPLAAERYPVTRSIGVAEVLLSCDFESGWGPNASNHPTSDAAAWQISNVHASSGAYSIYHETTQAASSWVLVGPVNLYGRTGAQLTWDMRYELLGDQHRVRAWYYQGDQAPTSLTQMQYYGDDPYWGGGWSGTSNGSWESMSIDLAHWHFLSYGWFWDDNLTTTNKPTWFAIEYDSGFDFVGQGLWGEGVYVDKIQVSVGGAGGDAPVVTSVTPSSASAGTATRVTISGQKFGSSQGKVEFTYQMPPRPYEPIFASIVSWTDTSIVCEVPAYPIDNYPASAGSGPITVVTATGARSAGTAFEVPFGYGGIKWSVPNISYRVNPPPGLEGPATAMVQAAANTWNATGAAFSMTYGGPCDSLDINADGFNDLGWAQLEDGVIAHAGGLVSGADPPTIVEMDICFNTLYPWNDGSAGSFDVQTTCIHELGHWFRLLDLYCGNDVTKAMYGFGDAGEVKRTLHSGDIAGIKWIYPGGAPTQPTLSSLVPNHGPGGTQVTIAGTNLGASGTVRFGATAASTSSWSANQIVCAVPNGLSPGSVNVTVETGGKTSNAVAFTVEPTAQDTVTASIVSVSPNPAAFGQSITFTGSGSDSLGHAITAYEWSEGATILSTASSFSKSDLSVGAHTIGLRVRCQSNVWSQLKTVSVTVNGGGGGDDPPGDVPGAALPASPVDGSLDEATDADDVYAVNLVAGQCVRFELSGAADTDFDLFLFKPNTPSVVGTGWRNWVCASSEYAGTEEFIAYRVPVTGTYYLDAYAYEGTGAYTLKYGYPASPVTLTLSGPSSVAYGGTAKISGKATDAFATGLIGYPVLLESQTVGTSTWKGVAVTVTDASGGYSFSVKPAIKTTYRVTFYGDFNFMPTSATRAVTPKAYVGNPVAPTYARRNVAFTTYGYLKPKHTAGSYPVRIYKYRYVSGKWRAYGYVNARAYNYSTYTKYSVGVKLPYKGRWRLRAYHADTGHAAAWSSGYDYVTVR